MQHINDISRQLISVDAETARLAGIIWRSRMLFESGYPPRQGLWDARLLEWTMISDPNARDANVSWAISLARTLQASI